MSVSVRRAGADDVPGLLALIERAYRGESAKAGWTHEADLIGGQRTDAAWLAAALAEPGTEMLVAEEAGALAGCVLLSNRGGGAAYLGLLTVEPGRQGGGLGSLLTLAAETRARERGFGRIEMRVIAQRAELIGYYERRGYADTGRREPFPYGDARFGVPVRGDLAFVVMGKALG